MRLTVSVCVLALIGSGTVARAIDPADKCEAAKLKRAGQYHFCRLKAEAKAVKSGGMPDFSKCDSTFSEKWADAEAAGGCPTGGDAAAIQNRVIGDASFVALQLAGERFVDNGDETVTDTQTGLMWEKKINLDNNANIGDPHDADNTYSWSSSGTAADGTAFTNFVSNLNNCASPDGGTVSGGFAGYCDWRLPTIAELLTIVDPTASGCGSGNPCIFSDLGPTKAYDYWSSTSNSNNSAQAWDVYFLGGIVFTPNKVIGVPVFARAVRAAS